MNEIWAPQANVLIDLVSSDPALIDIDPVQNGREMGAFEADGITPDAKQGGSSRSAGSLLPIG